MTTTFGKRTIALALVVLAGSLLVAAKPQNVDKEAEWVAPQQADSLINAVAGDKKAMDEGKKLYKQMCDVCHGSKGKGDGVAGATLRPRPANFTKKEFQEQSDGAIFWKITVGRPPMAAYGSLLTPEQRWQLVRYLRVFEKK